MHVWGYNGSRIVRCEIPNALAPLSSYESIYCPQSSEGPCLSHIVYQLTLETWCILDAYDDPYRRPSPYHLPHSARHRDWLLRASSSRESVFRGFPLSKGEWVECARVPVSAISRLYKELAHFRCVKPYATLQQSRAARMVTPVMSDRFHKQLAKVGVTSLRYPAGSPLISALAFRWYQSKKCHELFCSGNAFEITNLNRHIYSVYPGGTGRSLKCTNASTEEMVILSLLICRLILSWTHPLDFQEMSRFSGSCPLQAAFRSWWEGALNLDA